MKRAEAIRRVHTILSMFGCRACRLTAAREVVRGRHARLRPETVRVAKSFVTAQTALPRAERPVHNLTTCLKAGHAYAERL